MNTVIIMAVFTIALICFSNVAAFDLHGNPAGGEAFDVRCFDFVLAFPFCLLGYFVSSYCSGTISVGHNGVLILGVGLLKPEDACGV
jgi:hypothetical protein